MERTELSERYWDNETQSSTDTTLREFFEFAKKNNLMDYRIKIQFRDEGGDYIGMENAYFFLDKDDDGNDIIVL